MKKLRLLSLVLLLCQNAWSSVVLQNIDGNKVEFSTLKGKWVFINYWASWCHPCLAEIKNFNRFYASHQDNVALFGVNYDSLPIDEQKNLVRQLNIRYPTLANNPARALRLGDINAVPATFIFNPEGQLVKTVYGGQTLNQLNELFAEIQG